MTGPDDTTLTPVTLPVPLAGVEREEAERIVRSTRQALAEAFERLGIDAAPRLPSYAVREGRAS